MHTWNAAAEGRGQGRKGLVEYSRELRPRHPAYTSSTYSKLQEVADAHADLHRLLEQGVVICAERTPPSQFDHKSYLLTVSWLVD